MAAAAHLAARLAELGVSPGPPPALELKGPSETAVTALAAVDEAGPGALTFAVAPGYLRTAAEAGAAAAIVTPDLAGGDPPLPVLVCAEPRLIFAVLLALLGRRPAAESGQAVFADRDSVTLGPGAVIGEGAYIGRGVRLGARTVIGPQAFVGDGVVIGDDGLIHPRAVLRWGVRVGDRCQIHSGAVIGDDGFGYTQLPHPAAGRLIHFKNEHLGGVIIEDDVEIGANSTIDRGLVSDTVIGRGTKIDNLVQIGHNCRVGRDCIVVSQVGVAGHTVVGDRVFLLGQAGLGPGVTVGQDAILSAQSGLGSGSLPPGRRVWIGTPARPMEETYRTAALSASQLPKVRRFFQILKKSVSFEDLKAAFFASDQDSGKESK